MDIFAPSSWTVMPRGTEIVFSGAAGWASPGAGAAAGAACVAEAAVAAAGAGVGAAACLAGRGACAGVVGAVRSALGRCAAGAARRAGLAGRARAGCWSWPSVPFSALSLSFDATSSSTVEEWLFATTPMDASAVSTSRLDIPSSLASS